MDNGLRATGGGIGFLSAAGLLLIALKLKHNIDWSWWWILAPFWAPYIALILFIAIVLFFNRGEL